MGVYIDLIGGASTLVDEEDLPRIRVHRWAAVAVKKQHPNRLYVYSRIDGRNVYLHRFILRPPNGLMVDHKNGDTLDNRRENLRCANSIQNAANSGLKPGLSGYRGVSVTKGGKFSVKIYSEDLISGRKSRYCGVYSTAEEAARAWDAAAKEKYGDFARLNFPHEATP